MENDRRTDIKENLVDIKYYFQLDFPGQKIKGNRKFEEFKKQKLKELGKDAKLFYCKYDYIYFYVHIETCKVYPCFYEQCPICENYICYFCGRNDEEPINDIKNKGRCCVGLKLYYLIFYFDDKEISNADFIISLIGYFFPFISLIGILLFFVEEFFFRLILKNKKIFLTEFFLLISFIIHDIYIKIIILIISLFNNFMPLKLLAKILASI